MSVLPSSVAPNTAVSYVVPGKVTYYPDGSYSLEKASYYSQQQSMPVGYDNAAFAPPLTAAPSSQTRETPLSIAANRGARSAFKPKEIAMDAGIGGIAAALWAGWYKFRGYSRPLAGNLILIPMMMAFGILARGFVGGVRGYESAKQEKSGYWG